MKEKTLQPSDDIVNSLLYLRDELMNRILMQDSDTTNLKQVVLRINLCLYEEYKWK
jgi:hypothetical protein